MGHEEKVRSVISVTVASEFIIGQSEVNKSCKSWGSVGEAI